MRRCHKGLYLGREWCWWGRSWSVVFRPLSVHRCRVLLLLRVVVVGLGLVGSIDMIAVVVARLTIVLQVCTLAHRGMVF